MKYQAWKLGISNREYILRDKKYLEKLCKSTILLEANYILKSTVDRNIENNGAPLSMSLSTYRDDQRIGEYWSKEGKIESWRRVPWGVELGGPEEFNECILGWVEVALK